MKTKLFFLPVLALTATLSVSAQQIENDDLYFTAKDRAKEKASYAASVSANKELVSKGIRSSDQYSGRNVNPEYTSRFNADSDAIQGSTNPYYDSDYQSNNSGYSTNFNNPYYGNNRFYNSYNSWNSPYYSGMYGYPGMYGFSPYSSFYSSFYSPFYSPFGFSSGLSMSLAFGNGFYSPFYGYNSMMYGYGGFGNYMGMGYPYYGGGYYPTTVIINNGDTRSNVTYGKRSARSSALDNSMTSANRRTSASGTSQTQNTQNVIPITSRNASQQYYESNWRNNPEVNAAINSSRQYNNGTVNSRSQSLGTQNPSLNNNGMSRQSQGPDWNSIRQSTPAPSHNFGTPSSSPSWGGGGSNAGSSGGGSSRGR